MTALRPDETLLDNAAWHSLTGPHANFAEVRGNARRYPPDVSPFTALPDDADAEAWHDLAKLVGPGQTVVVTGQRSEPPASWERVFGGEGVQLVDDGVAAEPAPDAVVLTAADVPDMLDLVERTQPGPFLPRTVELGTYLGIREHGELIAMAGQRLRPPGWVEISAVCTAESARRRGLAARLVRAVAFDIRADGSTPLLHTGADNTGAIALYESLGFRLRRRTTFNAYRSPGVQLGATS